MRPPTLYLAADGVRFGHAGEINAARRVLRRSTSAWREHAFEVGLELWLDADLDFPAATRLGARGRAAGVVWSVKQTGYRAIRTESIDHRRDSLRVVLADAGDGMGAERRKTLSARGLQCAIDAPERQKVHPREVEIDFPSPCAAVRAIWFRAPFTENRQPRFRGAL